MSTAYKKIDNIKCHEAPVDKHNRIPLLASPADTALSAVERQVLEQLPVCTMVLGSGGEVVFLSSRAGDLLRKSGIKMDARKLDDWLVPGEQAKLKSGIAECLARNLSQEITLTLKVEADSAASPSPLVSLKLSPRAVSLTEAGDRHVFAVLEPVNPAVDTPPSEEKEIAELPEQKSSLLSVVSHEFRTPLNAIIGFAQLLQRKQDVPVSDEKRDEYAGHILDSARDLLSLTNSMLDMSKIALGRFSVTPEPIDLAETLRTCVDRLQPIADHEGITLECNTDKEPLVLDADPRATRQIVINLVANAIKFSTRGGTVKLFARRCTDAVEFEVSDSGIGMNAADLARLGEAFFQADGGLDRNYQGTGLGMSIVMGLVKLHGGTVNTQSAPGIGTTVTVSLPAPREMPRPVPADPGAEIVFINDSKHPHMTRQASALARKIQ